MRIPTASALALGDNLIDQTVLSGRFRRHEIVAIGIFFNPFQRLTGHFRQHLVHPSTDIQNMIGVNLYIAGLSLRSAERLMNHHFAVGSALRFPLAPGRQQEGGHAGGHTNTDGGYIAANELHCIVNRHAGGNRARRGC